MNTILKDDFVPHDSNLAPGANRRFASDDAPQFFLDDPNAEISDTEIMAILDQNPHDEMIHAAIIKRRSLSEQVVARLVAVVSPAQFDILVSRHALPDGSRREVMKRRRGRPSWWNRVLLSYPR